MEEDRKYIYYVLSLVHNVTHTHDNDATQYPNAKIDSISIPTLLSVALAHQIVPLAHY